MDGSSDRHAEMYPISLEVMPSAAKVESRRRPWTDGTPPLVASAPTARRGIQVVAVVDARLGPSEDRHRAEGKTGVSKHSERLEHGFHVLDTVVGSVVILCLLVWLFLGAWPVFAALLLAVGIVAACLGLAYAIGWLLERMRRPRTIAH